MPANVFDGIQDQELRNAVADAARQRVFSRGVVRAAETVFPHNEEHFPTDDLGSWSSLPRAAASERLTDLAAQGSSTDPIVQKTQELAALIPGDDAREKYAAAARLLADVASVDLASRKFFDDLRVVSQADQVAIVEQWTKELNGTSVNQGVPVKADALDAFECAAQAAGEPLNRVDVIMFMQTYNEMLPTEVTLGASPTLN